MKGDSNMRIEKISNETIETAKEVVDDLFRYSAGGTDFTYHLEKWYRNNKSKPYALRLSVIACAIVTGIYCKDNYYTRPANVAIRQMLPKVHKALKHHERLLLCTIDTHYSQIQLEVFELFTNHHWVFYFNKPDEEPLFTNLYGINAHVDPEEKKYNKKVH